MPPMPSPLRSKTFRRGLAVSWVVFGILCLVIGRRSARYLGVLQASLGILSLIGAPRFKRRARSSWLSLDGTVEHVQVAEHPDILRQRYVLLVRYRYYVKGERYSGLDWYPFRDKLAAEGTGARLSGSTVNVRYNPQDPDRSVLS